MSSEWWDEIFTEQYSILKEFYIKVFFIGLVLRTLVALLISFEAGFGNSQLLIVASIGVFLALAMLLESCNLIFKKIFLFSYIQIFLLLSRYISLEVAKSAELPICIFSTLVVLHFESNIFKNNFSTILLMSKHSLLWCFIDFKSSSINIDVFNRDKIFVIGSLVTILLAYYFETMKKKNLLEKFELKQKNKEAHDQLYQILKLFPDGLVIFDLKLNVKFQNETVKEIFPEGRREVVEQLKYFKEVYNNRSAFDLLSEFASNEDSSSSLGIFSRFRNQYEWKVHKINWDRQICILLSICDVSKILKLERVTVENNTKNMIIRSISHEFRTPINCINLVVDECLQSVSESDRNKLSIIKTCTELLMFQINDIIDYSNLTSNNFRLLNSVVDLKTTLKNTLGLIKFQSAYKGLKLECQIDPTIPDELYLDGYRVQKIIVNLLTNAQKFTSNGVISLFAIRKLDFITIGVSDTGIGISSHQIKNLFKMFTKASVSSLSGLGLSISQEILKFLNSSLSVSSQEGKGSVFSFDLMISQENCSKTDNSPVFQKANYSNEGISSALETVVIDTSDFKFSIRTPKEGYTKLLIVDDNEFNRMCLASILKNEDICFIEANDGKEALEKIIVSDGLKQPISVVIMDCNMPVMDGWESCSMIKQMFNQGKISKMPSVIGHTAFTNPEDIQKCYESGMVYCIPKPSSREEIVSVVKKHLVI